MKPPPDARRLDCQRWLDVACSASMIDDQEGRAGDKGSLERRTAGDERLLSAGITGSEMGKSG
jgi:hypothetical protein